MTDTEWVMSDGGPLILIEQRFKNLWEGISGLTVTIDLAKNDYDRACLCSRYLDSIPLRDGSALIIGDAALDTAFWRSDAGQLFLARIWCCEADFDVDVVMRAVDDRLFQDPDETLELPSPRRT